ncbi:MAG: alpha-glycosidase [Lachnospiraceae bacterium]|nr:alpha-glycosidase [Lachnospiraceae bacterium]
MDSDKLNDIIQKGKFITNYKPVLNRRALFSDYSEDYIIPLEPNAYGVVTIKLRSVRNNIDYAKLVCNGENILMEITESTDEFDFYSAKYRLSNEMIRYHFEVGSAGVKCFYDTRGVVKNPEDYFDFRIRPGFKTPDWAKGAVIYQIYTDRFYNGDPTNDVLTDEYKYIGENVTKVDDWNKYPAYMGVREFYGGDLAGVMAKLDYLQDLGIDAIYFNPLFVSPSNHKYDIQDYDYIDPHFGKIVDDRGDLLTGKKTENKDAGRYINRVTGRANLEASNKFFASFVQEAHKRGIKVIIDGVFNHCGSFNKWMDRERIYEEQEGYEKGAYVDKNSPYHDFFRFFEDKWPYNGTYDGWWGHDTLPKLNYEGSRELRDYVLRIARKWVSPPYNVDGWRLDVAADLGHSPEYNHQFWKDFRRVVKEANPNAIIIAEHYGDPSGWLMGDEWDTIMNYDAFMEPVTWFLTGMQKHSDDFRQDMLGNADAFEGMMRDGVTKFMAPTLFTTMNELSNHDHSRFLTRTNHTVGRVADKGYEAANQGVNKAVMREAVVIQMTWAGSPTIYYGDEAGVCGFTDPDNRRTYPWGNEDKELIRFHKEMIRIHKENRELITGAGIMMHKDYNVIAFGRFIKNNEIIVIVNNNDCEKEMDMRVWQTGVPRESKLTRLMLTDADGFSTEPEEYEVVNGRLTITMPGTSAIVLKGRQGPSASEKKDEENKHVSPLQRLEFLLH